MHKTPTHLGLALVVLASLSACGGGGGGDVAGALVNGLNCGLRNCTESSTLRTDEISLRFIAEQTDSQPTVTVSGFLGKSANVLTTVLISNNERLDAAADGSADTRMLNPDGQRLDYTASFPVRSAQPRARVAFVRDGVSHAAEVVLPPSFAVAAPVGTPTLARSSGNVLVTLAPAVSASGLAATGTCSRKNGTTFDLKDESLNARNEPGVAGAYRVDTLDVDAKMNAVSQRLNNSDPNTAIVTRCNLRLTWSVSASGTVATTLNTHSSFVGYRRASHSLVYDATL